MLTGKTIPMYASASDTTVALRERIADLSKIPLDQFGLKHLGKQLEDGRTLQDYNIQKESNVSIVLTVRGGAKVDKAELARTFFLAGARDCLDIDVEEQISLLTGRGTCRIFPMGDLDHRKCVMTTAGSAALLKAAKDQTGTCRIEVGNRSVRVRRWDPRKKSKPRRWKVSDYTDADAEATEEPEADEPEADPSASSSTGVCMNAQTMASGHAMKIVIGRLHHSMDRLKHSVMLLEDVWGHDQIDVDDMYVTHPPPPGLDQCKADLVGHAPAAVPLPQPELSGALPTIPRSWRDAAADASSRPGEANISKSDMLAARPPNATGEHGSGVATMSTAKVTSGGANISVENILPRSL